MESDSSPRSRILNAADRLFYSNGYESTGINRILQEAGAHKLSFYQYFPSKVDLALAYLRRQREAIASLLEVLFQKEDPLEMVQSWVRILKRQSRKSDFHGCPFANFSAQTLNQGDDFRSELQAAIREWNEMLAAYFENARAAGKLRSKISGQSLARKFLTIYEGNAQLYLITGRSQYLENIYEDFRDLLD